MDQRIHATDAIDAVASYFGVLSEPTRIRIMDAICEEEKTVSQIVEELGASQTNVSRHLGIMHRSGVLARRKQGNQVYYRTADAAMVELCRSVCKRISEHMKETLPLRGELLRLMPQPKRKPKLKQHAD
jgi:DNA-binding transcriptional ArsR family regulator